MDKFNLPKGLLDAVSSVVSGSKKQQAEQSTQFKQAMDQKYKPTMLRPLSAESLAEQPKREIKDASLHSSIREVFVKSATAAQQEQQSAVGRINSMYARTGAARPVTEAKAHTVPKTEREKDLAAAAHPKDKITHKDVLVKRGVVNAVGESNNPFDYKNYKSQIPSKPGEKAGFDSKKISTGTVYSRKPVKESIAAAQHLERAKAARTEGERHGHMIEHHLEMARVHNQFNDKWQSDNHFDLAKKHADQLTEISKKAKLDEDLQAVLEKITVVRDHPPAGQAYDQTKTDGGITSGIRYMPPSQKPAGAQNKPRLRPTNTSPAGSKSDSPGLQNALARIKAAKNTSMKTEEVEQVDEISDNTKRDYIDRAAIDTARLGNTLGRLQANKASAPMQKVVGTKITNRIKGISRAAQTIKNEEKDTPGNSYDHQCAIHVKHNTMGEGKTLFSQHADPAEDGTIAWYDIMFEHGIEKQIPTADLEIVVSESHMNHKKKK